MSEISFTKKQVKCPQCGRPTVYAPENPSRPFCSERCRNIDLGAWADEAYRIPVTDTSFEEESSKDD